MKNRQRDGLAVRVGILLLAGCALGFAANALRPTGAVPWVQDWSRVVETKALKAGVGLVSREETDALRQSGRALLLDARPAEEFSAGRIPGAMSLPFRDVENTFAQVQMFLTPDTELVAYCSGASCDDSLMLAQFLQEQGYTNVVIYAGGFQEWESAGMPVEGRP